MASRRGADASTGIDEFIPGSNLGQPQAGHVEAMERFAAQVMPHFGGGQESEGRATAA